MTAQDVLDLGFGGRILLQDFVGNGSHDAMAFGAPGPRGRHGKKGHQKDPGEDTVRHDTLRQCRSPVATVMSSKILRAKTGRLE
jgi:hypothetical protein